MRPACLILALLLATPALAQTSRPQRPGRPGLTRATSILEAIRVLTGEGLDAKRDGVLPRVEADFALTFEGELAAPVVIDRILRPQHRDPVVDAYIRWQLTSFEPELGRLDDRSFRRALAELPDIIENPAADRSFMELLSRAMAAGTLGEADRERLSTRIDELVETRARARTLAAPARGLRAWLFERLIPEPERALMVELERVEALINGGWDVDRAKQETEDRFAKLTADPDLTVEARERLARLASELTTTRRAYVQSADVNDEGRVTVAFADSAVYDFEVRRWVRLLRPDDDR